MARSSRALLLAAGLLVASPAPPAGAVTLVFHGDVTSSAGPGGSAFVNIPLVGDAGTLSLTFDEDALELVGDVEGQATYTVGPAWSTQFDCAPGSCGAGIDGAFGALGEGLFFVYEDGASFDTLHIQGFASLESATLQLASAGPGTGSDRVGLAGLLAAFDEAGWCGSFELLDQGGDGFGGSVTAAPEPATALLLGLGLAALARRARPRSA